jgi:hypothetical protein
MPNELEWSGTCRGQITEYALAEMKTGAVAINLTARVTEYWDEETGEWKDCSTGDLETGGPVWIILKNGNINQPAAESLMKHAGWDGDLTSIENQRWEPTPCAFVVKIDNYNDEVRYRIGYINAFEAIPSGGSTAVSVDRITALQAQYGPQLRALAGSIEMNATPPPAAPPPAPSTPAQAPSTPVPGPKPEDGIPF